MISTGRILLFTALMALTTYLIRMLPFTCVRRKLTNVRIRSMLHYIPYAVLSAMTIPEILNATASVWSAAAGLAVALVLAIRKKGLLLVAVSACAAVFVVEWFLQMNGVIAF